MVPGFSVSEWEGGGGCIRHVLNLSRTLVPFPYSQFILWNKSVMWLHLECVSKFCSLLVDQHAGHKNSSYISCKWNVENEHTFRHVCIDVLLRQDCFSVIKRDLSCLVDSRVGSKGQLE